jgi:protein SCO1/2
MRALRHIRKTGLKMNRRKMRYTVFSIASLLWFGACSQGGSVKKLPIYGPKQLVESEEGGMQLDTSYHKIPNFTFVDQDSSMVNNQTFEDKVYVADFFFTTCPTICPKMKAQMLRVYEAFYENDQVAILSHTIDPEYDDVEALHDFANKLGVESKKWRFVTGQKKDILDIALKGYMVTAMEDETAPGGLVHSGAFILIDKKGRVRGLYDGTEPMEVDQLINDIPVLLKEYEG